MPPRMALMILGVFLGLVAAVGAIGYWLPTRNAAAAPVSKLPEATAPTYAAQPGPWGVIQCQRSIIEVPEAYLGTRNWETEPMQWFFRGYAPEGLNQFLARLGLSPSESKDLGEARNWRVTKEGIFVSPLLETVLSLAPETRATLYAELAKDEENVMQNQPFHWLRTDAEHLFDGTRATPEAIAVFRKLSYVRGKYLLFSDWKALLLALPDAEQRAVVAQALMGRFLLFASIRITPQTDVPALLRYWGNGGSARDIRPILEAAARIPEGMDLSIANLLPPHVRAQINTFPFTTPNEQLNCHWTAFNFFNATPEPPANVRFWRNKLQSEYLQITTPPQYGDILVLLKPDNKLIHSCVYLADNIVYTKNGGSPFAPWQLCTLPDLLAFYSWDLPENTALKTAWYRKRS